MLSTITVRPACRRCGGRLQGRTLPVRDGSLSVDVISCQLCGEIYRERLATEKAAARIDVASLRNAQKRRVCRLRDCQGNHYSGGFCEPHYKEARRALAQ